MMLTYLFLSTTIDNERGLRMKYNIKIFREAKGMTQQDLADKAGCSRQFVNMLENSDEINVSTKVLVNIANALERTVDDLIFFEK